MRTRVELEFANGVYSFALTLPGCSELDRKCDGLGALFSRILAGRYIPKVGDPFGSPLEAKWRAADVRETIRQGLIGGGQGVVDGQTVKIGPVETNRLMDTYCFPNRPLSQDWDLAAAILTAAVEGIEDEPDTGAKKKSSKPKPAAEGSDTMTS